MKKILTFTIVYCLLMSLRMFAQCPDISIVLDEQYEINSFATDYPNCTELLGNLYIGGLPDDPFSNVFDLSPLSQITSIDGSLSIERNSELESLAGLENLTSVNSRIEISRNDSLIDLTALQNLTHVNSLLIAHNDVLTDLTGIDNIDFSTMTFGLNISYNPNLSVCNIDNICDYMIMGGDVGIQYNAPGCNSDVEVGAACNISIDCPLGDVVLTTQQEVEEFAAIYPNCTEIGGILSIGFLNGSSITDVTPLGNITSVGEMLWIGFNNQLSSLVGLNIKTVGTTLHISNLSGLPNLNGLDSLTFIGENLTIHSNNSLTDISALSNLNSVATDISINNNPALTNIFGIANIDADIIDRLRIYDNPSLSFCGVKSVCDYLENPGTITEIYNNDSGCNEVVEILNTCDWGRISGSIFSDQNENCNKDDSEPSLGNWLVKVENDNTIKYTYTAADGSYIIPCDVGSYTVSVISPDASLWEICPAIDVFVSESNSNLDVHLGAIPLLNCPILEVDISSPIIRRCFTSNYYVRYCNLGTITAENAYVEVQLDPFFTYENSTIPEADLGDNLYSFDLGNIDVGECSNFRIDVLVDCDSTVLGQIHCAEAHIYPDSTCTPPALPLWDGASIELGAQCLGDSIKFKIENTGTGDMSDSLEYTIITNDFIWQQANFQLNSGEQWIFSKAANGAFHRLETGQSPGHPGSSMPSIFVEGCGENANGTFSTGFFNDYPLNEGDVFISIDCQENVGAYDPNDKQAFPGGYGEQHYITDSTDLEYMIRFQNTGTDTAFNIVIRDTISPHLNIETLRPGVASHDYRYDIEERTAIFTFENIMLPDSNVNEAASHGFIKFDIEQQRDNPISTLIENNAGIYFDFNEPIITNTVFHTVGEDFMNVITSVTTPPELADAGISVNVFPNPFDEYTRFEVQGETIQELHLTLYDMMGRQVLRQQSTNQQHITLYKNDLPTSVYVFRLMDEKQPLATGKLIVK